MRLSGSLRGQSVVSYVPRVSQGSFFQEQMSSPVSRMAWSWWRPSLPPRVDCQWQKLFSVWSAWWLITKPSCEIQSITGGREGDSVVFMVETNKLSQLGLYRQLANWFVIRYMPKGRVGWDGINKLSVAARKKKKQEGHFSHFWHSSSW